MQKPVKTERAPRRLIYIAIDALHPKYLELDSKGLLGGKDGDWLMPSIRSFLNRAVWYPEVKAYLPAAADMNHLNALAGTSMAQNGIIGDLGATAASLMGLQLRSTVIGQDLSSDLISRHSIPAL